MRRAVGGEPGASWISVMLAVSIGRGIPNRRTYAASRSVTFAVTTLEKEGD